jgi:hypothetical protein
MRIALIFLTLLAATPIAAQNLLTTPDFDAVGDVANWPDPFPDANTTISWRSDLDVDGSPSSGSLRLENSITNGASDGPRQCLDLGPDAYEFEAWVYNPTQTPQPRATLFIEYYSQPGCSNFIAQTTAHDSPILDDWELLSVAEQAPAGTASIGFRPESGSTSDPTTTTVYYDALYLPEPGSTSGLAAGAVLLVALRRRRRAPR